MLMKGGKAKKRNWNQCFFLHFLARPFRIASQSLSNWNLALLSTLIRLSLPNVAIHLDNYLGH